MNALFEFFTKRHLLANALTLLILLGGIYAALTINLEELPNTDIGMITVTTGYPSASPEDVELNITNKIEDSLISIVGIDSLTSTSVENSSMITIQVEQDADQDEVFNEVQDAVSKITDLPNEANTPVVTVMNPALKPVLEVGITSETLSYREIRAYADQFEKKVLNINGVSGVTKSGYRDREVRIEVSPDKMVKYNVSMNEVLVAIQNYNTRVSGGSLESFTSQKNVVTLANFRDPADVGEVIVKSFSNGSVVRVNDVARVEDDFVEETTKTRINGKSTISLNIQKTEQADVITTVEAVKELIEKEKKYLDDDAIQFLLTSDSSVGVLDKFDIVRTNGLMGLILVLVVLAFFLNFRGAFWVAMGIPMSLLGVIMVLPFFGVDLDSLTMAAMVLVIGIIVDDAIVITENIYRHREEGEGPLEAAVNGLKEVALPVFTTIATTILAFLPMMFIEGKLGAFIFVVPLTVILAITISMLESYFILPAHLLPGLKGNKGKKFGKSWFIPVRNGFERLLKRLLRMRYVCVFVAFVIFSGTVIYTANSTKFILMEKGNNTESITASIEMPIGTSLEATTEAVAKIEAIIESLPEGEIDSYMTTVGSSGSFFSGETPHLATISLNLAPASNLTRGSNEISAEIRLKAASVTEIEKFFLGFVDKGPAAGQPVEVMVKGSDDTYRNMLTADVMSYLETIDGVYDVARDDKAGKEEIRIELDKLNLARNGLTAADVAQTVRTAYEGQVATSTRYGEEEIDFRVILEKSYRKDVEYLKQLKLKNNKGVFINLEEVADFDVAPGLYAWYHDEGERTITVTGSIDQKLVTPMEIMDSLNTRYANSFVDYPGTRIEVGGEAQQSKDAMVDILMSFVFAALGIYFLLMLLFNSVTQPLVVILTIPFGLIGSVLIFAMHGISQISFFAGIGMIGLVGVVVNDALVMIDHLNHLKRTAIKKANLEALVAKGAANRLRPVILTTVTTVAGLLPLTYGIGGEDTMMGPMAMALGYGLLLATPVILILLPCFFMIREDIGALLNRIFKSKNN